MRRRPLLIFLLYINILRSETDTALVGRSRESNKTEEQNGDELQYHLEEGAHHPHHGVPVCEEEMMMDLEDCFDVEEEECGDCREEKEERCTVHLETKYLPVKVKECKKMYNCAEGVTQKCFTQYRKECSQQKLMKEKEEAFPMCGIIMVDKCTRCEDCEPDQEVENCTEVPVMKCHMEKKMTKKEVEEPVCRSVPEQVCEDCEKCYTTVRLKRYIEPKEECKMVGKRVCDSLNIPHNSNSTVNNNNNSTVDNNNTNNNNNNCRLVTRKRCTPSTKIMIKKLCSKDYDWMIHQFP